MQPYSVAVRRNLREAGSETCVQTVSRKAAKPGGDTPEGRRTGSENPLNHAKIAG